MRLLRGKSDSGRMGYQVMINLFSSSAGVDSFALRRLPPLPSAFPNLLKDPLMSPELYPFPHLLLLVMALLAGGAIPVNAADAPPVAPQPAYPALAPPSQPGNLGVGVQRAMRLLATSTKKHRNHVRILFYGQSITEQDWWKRVADDLRRRFPHADLEIENRAIGGFASQLLVNAAEADLYPFQPDLVIFHVYGANDTYEAIIRNLRLRTTADILMQRDHVTAWPPAHPDEQADKGLWWDHMMNEQFLPDIAQRYGCGLVDVRGGWLEYLRAHHLEPKALLKDDVHLNDYGCFLMAELVKRYLVYRPDLPKSGAPEPVRTLLIGKEVKWRDGKLTLSFEGSRVDALSAWDGAGAPPRATVTVDGRKPSAFPGVYAVTRSTPGPWSPLFLIRTDHDTPLVPEAWTMTITSVSEDGKRWAYRVEGSVTGPDGEGSNDAPFTSKSGRVKVKPEYFFNSFGNSRPTVGYAITWKAVPTHADAFTPPQVEDPAREYAVTLAQGIPNTKHTLVLTAEPGKSVPLRALRVYQPPLR